MESEGSPRVLATIADMVGQNPALRIFSTTEKNPYTDEVENLYFRNGVLDLANNSFRPADPHDFFTAYINVNYPSEPMSCPNFDHFLESISGGDQTIIQTIWAMIGYLLVPDTRGKCFFVLQGVGDSGKSVLGNFIASLFNPESVAYLDIFRFKDRFSTSALRGKRLNISMDLPKGRISREAVGCIKLITGDDTITIEEKFKDARPYRPTCKLVFGTNHPILLSEPDQAFSNRMVTIPFHFPVPKAEQDKFLLQKLLAERPAVIPLALQSYQQLRQQNYIFPLMVANNSIFGYTSLAEHLAEFLQICCEFEENSFTPTALLMERFNHYRIQRKLPEVLDTVQFSRQLNRFCAGRITKKKRRIGTTTINGYMGIQLRDESSIEKS